jgi:HAD superfamily hydrolase (TIGR01509 family)
MASVGRAGHCFERDFMRIQAVIFDIDGLMIDSERVSNQSWKQVMAKAGFDLTEEIYMKMIGRTEKDVEGMLMSAYGPTFPFWEMHQQREVRFNEMILQDGLPVKPGLLELLDYVDARGLKKAVASSTYRVLAEKKLTAAGIRDRFEMIVTGDEVTHGKPAPDLFLAAAKKISAEPFESMVLEDSQAGIQAAYAAGMLPVLVPDMQPVEPAVEKLAFRKVGSLLNVIGILEELQ